MFWYIKTFEYIGNPKNVQRNLWKLPKASIKIKSSFTKANIGQISLKDFQKFKISSKHYPYRVFTI